MPKDCIHAQKQIYRNTNHRNIKSRRDRQVGQRRLQRTQHFRRHLLPMEIEVWRHGSGWHQTPKDLEEENRKLNMMVADLLLENHVFKEVIGLKRGPRTRSAISSNNCKRWNLASVRLAKQCSSLVQAWAINRNWHRMTTALRFCRNWQNVFRNGDLVNTFNWSDDVAMGGIIRRCIAN